MALKPSEYGGVDTDKTLGIQPAPHQLSPAEQLRVMYHEDPMDLIPNTPPELGEPEA